MEWLEYHADPVKLHSGGRSHWLVRGDLIFADERLREEVLAYWEMFVRGRRRPWHFWAVPRGGTPWAEALAKRVGGRWANLPMGHVRNGATAFTVDDVLTTGSSLSGTPGVMRLVVVDRMQREHYVPNSVAWNTMYLPLLPEVDGS